MSSSAHLLQFNHQLLGQALALAAAHEDSGAPDYARPVGAHLRHVIEHFEALLVPREPGVVDYDRRPRDAALERCPRLARERLRALQHRLSLLHGQPLDTPLLVQGVCGLAGDWPFAHPSSLGRELVFVGSHAVHHYALLQAHCRQHALPIAADFGVAPATVAHARATPTAITREDLPCTPLTATA